MKAIHITPTYFSSDSVLGGGERFVCEFAKAMSRYIEAEVISFGRSNKVVSLTGNLDLYIFKKWNKNMLNPFNPLFLNRLREADIIHCHQYLLSYTKLAIIFAKIFKKKIFVTDLGIMPPNPTWYFDWSRWIDKFLVISEFSGKYIERHYAKKEVIYAGVDIEKYRPAAQKGNKVLFVGRLLPHKGVDYLIKAMPADIELDIVGQVYDQGYYKLLKELASGKRVNFFHNLTDEEIVREFATAGIFVHPAVYKNELLGLVLLEAMASGCATIATNLGGAPEVILNNKTGFIVPSADLTSLRAKIEYLISNPKIAIQMGEAARKRVEEMFTWDLAAKRCLKAYGCSL